MAFSEFDLRLAPPGTMTMPNIVGGTVEGGRSLSGLVSVADLSGGGLVTVKYGQIALRNVNPAKLRYWSRLGAMLNGGVRSILVPLLTDFIAPFGLTVTAQAAALNAGTLSFLVRGDFLTDDFLNGGEWFEIAHLTRSSRAYCITDVDAITSNQDGSISYTVGIRPPLREAIGDGTVLRFERPRFLARLAPGTSINADVDAAWWATPDATFLESFGTF